MHNNERRAIELTVWTWLDARFQWLPIATRMRAAMAVGRWQQGTDRVRLRWLLRWERVSLCARPWPVAVAFHGYCCDTGPYTWYQVFRWGGGHGWRWPGLQALQATTWDALDGVSDGPTDYRVCRLQDAEAHEPSRCAGCGAGNAPYSEGEYDFCQACIGRERAAVEEDDWFGSMW